MELHQPKLSRISGYLRISHLRVWDSLSHTTNWEIYFDDIVVGLQKSMPILHGERPSGCLNPSKRYWSSQLFQVRGKNNIYIDIG